MDPAFSVIFFTVVSGARLWPDDDHRDGAGIQARIDRPHRGAACVDAGWRIRRGGLLSSMLHLGKPLRAWRAFSQWRSSWLSREGIASLVAFAPLLAAAGFLWQDMHADSLRVCGALLLLLALATLYCTSGIYTSLKTIRAWHNAYVLPGYLLLGRATGAACLCAIDALTGGGALNLSMAVVAAVLALAAVALKFAYLALHRRAGYGADDRERHGTRPLRQRAQCRSATYRRELPHERNGLPSRAQACAPPARDRTVPDRGRACAARAGRNDRVFIGAGHDRGADSALCVLLGTFVERWLFFAEARHVVMLYYASDRA